MRKHQIMRDHVRESLSRKIQSGILIPGDKLSELDVCGELGISRTPAREALLQLASEGVLEYTPRRGFRVKDISTKEKLEVYEIIEVMDALAAKLSLKAINELALSSMRESAEMMDISIKYRNYQEYYNLQRKFHDTYRNLCGNALLLKSLNGLLDGFIPQIYTKVRDDKIFEILSELNAEHRRIIHLFEKRDAEGLFNFIMNIHWRVKYEEMI